MQINLSELFSIDGKEKHFTCESELKQFQGPDGSYEIADMDPISLTLSNSGNKVIGVTGSTGVTLMIPCSRCLEPMKIPLHLEFDEMIDMKQSDEERAKALDEQFYVSGYTLDVDQLVSNELSLNLPMKVLCDENCKGICNRCGTNLNSGTCDCDTRSLDPRMSVIQDIFQQLKEV